jgi:hypothetical protein
VSAARYSAYLLLQLQLLLLLHGPLGELDFLLFDWQASRFISSMNWLRGGADQHCSAEPAVVTNVQQR